VPHLLLAVNKCLSENVYLFVNDKNVALAAREVAGLTGKTIHVLPTADPVAGIAGLFAFRSAGDAVPSDEAIMGAASHARPAQVFFAGKDATVGGVTVAEGKPAALAAGKLHAGDSLAGATAAALETLGAAGGGLITLYYGGVQTEKDAQRMSEEMQAAFPEAEVEYYYGGMKNAEFWISIDD